MEPARKARLTAARRPQMSPLARALRAKRMTMKELAMLLEVHRSTLNNWQRGHAVCDEVRIAVSESLLVLGIDPGLLFPAHAGDPVSNVTHLDSRRPGGSGGDHRSNQRPQEDPPVQTPREYLELEDLKAWQLDEDPFDDPDNPETIYRPPSLARIDNAMKMAVRRFEIIAVTGGPGSGKSTLLRAFYGRAGREKRIRLVSPASLDRQRITAAALSTAILRDLTGKECGSMTMERRSEMLRTCLADQGAAGISPVMIIDEAHLLSTKALLAIKQVWDSHTMFRQLSVFLIGQLLLKERLLHDPDIRELTGRTRILEIPRTDAGEYLRWRFARVGANADEVFEPSAYKALTAMAEYPLWINNKAVAAMRYAAELGEPKVEAVHVGRC